MQIIDGWEGYVRQKLDEGFKLVITGSNASLPGKELGTKLTGRHIGKELFPFSWRELCEFKKAKPSEKIILKYLQTGEFSEYVKKESE